MNMRASARELLQEGDSSRAGPHNQRALVRHEVSRCEWTRRKEVVGCRLRSVRLVLDAPPPGPAPPMTAGEEPQGLLVDPGATGWEDGTGERERTLDRRRAMETLG